MKSDYLEKSTL